MAAEPVAMESFAAIDFETADYGRDSACAIGVVRVEGGEIVEQNYQLIRPPRREFVFTYLHGIAWEHVADAPPFGEVWRVLQPTLRGVQFFAAHNASFDQGVLEACCQASGVPPPSLPFRCTVALARKTWGIYPTKLNHVCEYLGLELDHHQALSDAMACARIVMAANGTAGKRKQAR